MPKHFYILLAYLVFSVSTLTEAQSTDHSDDRCDLEGYFAGEIQKLVNQGSTKDEILEQIPTDHPNKESLSTLAVYIATHPNLNFIKLERETAKDGSRIMTLLAMAITEGHPMANDPVIQEMVREAEGSILLKYGPAGVAYKRRLDQALIEVRRAKYAPRTLGEKVNDLFFGKEDNPISGPDIEEIIISSPQDRSETVKERCLQDTAKRLADAAKNERLEQNPIFDPNIKPNLSE